MRALPPKGVCDRCGFEFLHRELRKEWTGLMVCRQCHDPRHPQDFVRGVKDKQSIPNPRPEPAEVFVITFQRDDDGNVLQGPDGIPLIE